MKAGLNTALAALCVAGAAAVNEHNARQEALVDEVNSKQPLWKAAINDRFRGQSLDAMKVLLGAKASRDILSKHAFQGLQTPGFIAPNEFDSLSRWPQCAKTIDDIRDQSACGCCWAFAAAGAASDRLCIATNGSVAQPFSAQSLCFCASENGCAGLDVFTPWKFIHDHGLVTGGQFNSSSGYCSDYTLPNCHHYGPQGSDPYPAENTTGGCRRQPMLLLPSPTIGFGMHSHLRRKSPASVQAAQSPRPPRFPRSATLRRLRRTPTMRQTDGPLAGTCTRTTRRALSRRRS